MIFGIAFLAGLVAGFICSGIQSHFEYKKWKKSIEELKSKDNEQR